RAKKAGIKKNITPHTFRHSSVQTTEKYIQYDWATVHADYCGFHLALSNLRNNCVLASDKNKICQEVYQLNFPTTPFLLGDINNKAIQKKIIATDFDLLCAGFPCQPYSRANKIRRKSQELESLSKIIKKKKPKYLLLENVPNFLLVNSSKFLLPLLTNYQLQMSVINPKELGVKQNRPRIFIWGEKNNTLTKSPKKTNLPPILAAMASSWEKVVELLFRLFLNLPNQTKLSKTKKATEYPKSKTTKSQNSPQKRLNLGRGCLHRDNKKHQPKRIGKDAPAMARKPTSSVKKGAIEKLLELNQEYSLRTGTSIGDYFFVAIDLDDL
ncbi:10339_t:CDS:2, partial [Cetraspora pellucida]